MVKEHVCFKTTALGCNPVNGKYLCEGVLAAYLDSANKTQAYTSGCKCVNPWLKSNCKLKIRLEKGSLILLAVDA